MRTVFYVILAISLNSELITHIIQTALLDYKINQVIAECWSLC